MCGEGSDPSIVLASSHCCICAKPGPGFPTSHVLVFLCSGRWAERWPFLLLILLELMTMTV